jgi:hypothetical protein
MAITSGFAAETVVMETTVSIPVEFKVEMQVDPLPVIRVAVNGQQTYVANESEQCLALFAHDSIYASNDFISSSLDLWRMAATFAPFSKSWLMSSLPIPPPAPVMTMTLSNTFMRFPPFFCGIHSLG